MSSNQNNKIILIAPLCSDPSSAWFSPGRERKLAQVEQIFHTFDFPFTRLSTAPFPPPSIDAAWIRLAQSAYWPLRLLQILCSSMYLRWKYRKFLPSCTIWLYNTRFAEALVAWVLLSSTHSPSRLILQLEDLPAARRANAGARGVLDLLATRWLATRASAVCCVSRPVSQAFERLSGYPANRTIPLPPLLDPCFLDAIKQRHSPFSRKPYRIVYAGGYESDKGVDILIQAFSCLDPSIFQLHLYGPIQSSLRDQLLNSPSVFIHGQVEPQELFYAYSQADILVNPHHPIRHSNYIFPFKLVEIMASGALPLSTPMPGIDDYLFPSQCLFRSAEQLKDCLSSAPLLWERYSTTIKSLQSEVMRRHSLSAACENLETILGSAPLSGVTQVVL